MRHRLCRHADIRMPNQIDPHLLPPGCYPLTGQAAGRGYRLNKFCHSLLDPVRRAAFAANADAEMRGAGLTDEEIQLVDARDWLAMVRYGASPFLVFRLSGVFGVGLAATGAQMRGETLEQFMQTRRVTGAR